MPWMAQIQRIRPCVRTPGCLSSPAAAAVEGAEASGAGRKLGPWPGWAVAESLERQPVPPAGPGEPEEWAEPGGRGAERPERGSSWCRGLCMCLRVLAAGQANYARWQVRQTSGAAERFRNGRPPPGANQPNARLRDQGEVALTFSLPGQGL